mmetsp:Transcript_30565/g.61089  ORF Transcript_30565/g.61089 Transcript_30565/m.61089 type:complete len:804 (-) Transcript_30565:127-2538(-)
MSAASIPECSISPHFSNISSTCSSKDENTMACLMPRSMFFITNTLIFVGIAVSCLLMYILWKRRQTRLELQEGNCNLPTVVWRPRFMNYTPTGDDDHDEFEYFDGQGTSSPSDDDIMKWARQFLEKQRTDGGNQLDKDDPRLKMKKMASSSITNILPRMERLAGPYGLYATVYGITTKVVHVAHPVPARAILSGSGVIDAPHGFDNLQNKSYLPFSSLWRTVRQIWFGNDTGSLKKQAQRRKSSTSLRLLTGSTKNPAYDHFKNFSGEGVFTADGQDWKAKRASVLHCLLRNGKTDQLLEVEANRAADSFEREVQFAKNIYNQGNRATCNDNEKNRSSDMCPVMNVVPMLQRSTIGLIYRLITHHNVEFSPGFDNNEIEPSDAGDYDADQSDSFTSSTSPRSSLSSLISLNNESIPSDNWCKVDPNDLIETAAKKPLSNVSRDNISNKGKNEEVKALLPTYLDSVTKIRMVILAQSRSFWYLVPRWAYRAFSPMFREEERTMGPIREFARLTCQNALPGSPLALLNERTSHSAGKDREKDQMSGLSKDLLDEAITLLFAGQDTSAATLSWTLHLLSLHPEIQQRAADEVRSVLDTVKSGETSNQLDNSTKVTKNLITQMPYLDAVIKESMRLYPVAPFIVRKLTTSITIPTETKTAAHPTQSTSNGAISLPEHTFACIWIYALHRNPKLWNSPDEFIPERWIDPQLQQKDQGQKEFGSYMPFAIGPRNCLGQPLAQIILRILLARILDKYVAVDPKFDAVLKLAEKEGVEVNSKCLRKDMQAGFTVLPSNGLKIKLVERDSSL